MLKAIKRFVGIEKKGSENIPFSALELWLDNKLKESDLFKELNELFRESSGSLNLLSISVKRIATRKLNVKENSDSIEDYREDYVLKMQGFLKQISLEKSDLNSIINYNENLSVALTQIDEGTKNQFSIIKKFFPEESENIMHELKILSEIQNKLSDIIKQENGLLFVNDIKKRMHEVRKKNKELETLKSQLEKEDGKKKQVEEYKMLLETDMDDLKTSPEYEKYDQLMSKKIRLEKELERENEHLRILFSPILKTLFEYDKKELGADRALARQYASDPISSLHNDRSLWLMNLLQSVSSKLPDIEQDEKKRLKIRQAILAISEDVLKNHMSKYFVIRDAMSQVNRQISVDNTTLKVEDIKYKLNHTNSQVSHVEESRKKIEEAISEINVEKDLLMLEKKLSVFGSIRLT